MRTWGRAKRDLRCGCCGATVPAGDPVLELRLHGPRRGGGLIHVNRVLYRCRELTCAGEAVPDMTNVLVLRPAPVTWTRFSAALVPREWKSAQAGEREPGEDDA